MKGLRSDACNGYGRVSAKSQHLRVVVKTTRTSRGAPALSAFPVMILDTMPFARDPNRQSGEGRRHAKFRVVLKTVPLLLACLRRSVEVPACATGQQPGSLYTVNKLNPLAD
jgi:hypothetical protein